MSSPGLIPAIHAFVSAAASKAWIPGTRPGMTAHELHFLIGFQSSKIAATDREEVTWHMQVIRA
jgi:hypothetical protein